MPVLLILITVGLNTLAQALLKLGSGQSLLNFYLLGGVSAYGLSTILYILVLDKLNLSVAYPVVIGLTVASTTLTGAYFLGEQVARIQWIGIGLMLSGISAIALGKVS
ncbi:MAG: small multidrug resistance protein [Acaryochloridaceae cyanobacterium CSU_3_4]|nr:small multidrug resistance protein [Acaryochloridaceae cyanobacterium CSU_3_4]